METMRYTAGPIPCPFCGRDCGIVEADDGGEYAAHAEPQCPTYMVGDGDDFIRAAGKALEERRLKKTPKA